MTGSSFDVQPAALSGAGGRLLSSADALAGLEATAPDVSMYGSLVGAAAADAEPATTDDLNTLLDALATYVDSICTRLATSAVAYDSVEATNAEHARVI